VLAALKMSSEAPSSSGDQLSNAEFKNLYLSLVTGEQAQSSLGSVNKSMDSGRENDLMKKQHGPLSPAVQQIVSTGVIRMAG
jgi:hypothetical protein